VYVKLNNLYPIEISKINTFLLIFFVGFIGVAISILFLISSIYFELNIFYMIVSICGVLLSFFNLFYSIFVFPKKIILNSNKIELKCLIGKKIYYYTKNDILEILKTNYQNKELLILRFKNLKLKGIKGITILKKQSKHSLDDIYNFLKNYQPNDT